MNGPTLEEEGEQRLRSENRWLREQWQIAIADSQRWRRSFHDAMYYLAAVSPPLTELAEDDNFRRFRDGTL